MKSLPPALHTMMDIGGVKIPDGVLQLQRDGSTENRNGDVVEPSVGGTDVTVQSTKKS
jgi:hypothetical protein